MAESRWLRWIGPGVVALGAVALDRVNDARRRRPAVGAARLRRSAGRRDRRGARRRHRPRPRTCAARPGSAWTRSLDGEGALRGQRLAVGRRRRSRRAGRGPARRVVRRRPFGRDRPRRLG